MNVETREAVAMEVTTDDAHDSEVFPRLLEEAESHGKGLEGLWMRGIWRGKGLRVL